MIIIFTIIAILSFTISWLVHVEMNKETQNPFGYGSFGDFLCEIEKIKSHPLLEVKEKYAAIFERNGCRTLYLWASIIEFDRKRMILSPIGWAKFLVWSRMYLVDQNKRRNNGRWFRRWKDLNNDN